jgi:UDP-N-acetylglucosamine 2-epimerase (non-hydrolysing)
LHKLWIVVGTRPNFIKVTQFKRVIDQRFPKIDLTIIHTGQHYDENMAQVFFDQFGLRPDVFLDVQPAQPAKQIAETISKLSDLFSEQRPNLVIVVGDVNSTLAAAIAANKNEIPMAHLESGLRSFDKTMPEEHNRIVADHLCQLHFVTEDSGLVNLRKEGVDEKGIAFVGNTMIDTLVAFQDRIEESDIINKIGLKPNTYILTTLHRPSNVDNKQSAQLLIDLLNRLTQYGPILFPMHPRTRNKLEEWDLLDQIDQNLRIHLTGPASYFDFQKMISESKLVLTDSGGIQEETTFLKKPCLTLRENTERPSTIEIGTNELLPFSIDKIEEKVRAIFEGKGKQGTVPVFWDGKATERVLERIAKFFEQGF